MPGPVALPPSRPRTRLGGNRPAPRVQCPAAKRGLTVGARIDARDRVGMWLPAKVAAVKTTHGVCRVKVHFSGWKARHDEWLNPGQINTRIARAGSKTSPAQLAKQQQQQPKQQKQQKQKQHAEPPPDLSIQYIAPQRGRTRAPRLAQLESSLIHLYTELFPTQAKADPRVIAETVSSHTSFVLVGKRGKESETVGGVSFLLPADYNFAVVEFIGTSYQRCGHGTQLFVVMFEHLHSLRRLDIPVLAFADMKAVEFFKRCGFKEVDAGSPLRQQIRLCGAIEPKPSKLLVSEGGDARVSQLKRMQFSTVAVACTQVGRGVGTKVTKPSASEITPTSTKRKTNDGIDDTQLKKRRSAGGAGNCSEQRALWTKEEEEEYFKVVYGDEELDNQAEARIADATGEIRGRPLHTGMCNRKSLDSTTRSTQTIAKLTNKNHQTLVSNNPASSSRAASLMDHWLDRFRGENLNEDVCSICEDGGNLVCCEGYCSRSFHLACAGLLETPDQFVCNACTSGVEICFSCKAKSPMELLVRCAIPGCGKCYHRKRCLDKLIRVPLGAANWQQAPKGKLVCPLHMCTSCSVVPSQAGQLVRCVRCPLAYHWRCVPAGVPVSGRSLLCTQHTEHAAATEVIVDNTTTTVRWNLDACSVCCEGGALECCDTCIGAFHAQCISHVQGFSRIPKSGKWSCPNCVYGLKPALGSVIWAKGTSPLTTRLWPAQIVNDAPSSIGVGPVASFQARFFGRHGKPDEWQWLFHSQVLQWSIGDEKRHSQLDISTSLGSGQAENGCADCGTTALLKLALQEAKEAFAERELLNASRDRHGHLVRTSSFDSPLCQPQINEYRKIRCNVYVAKVRNEKDAPLDCECDSTNPCGPGCLNRLCFVECSARSCRHVAAGRCLNRRFQKRDYPKTRVIQAGGKGCGLHSREPIKAGTFVIEYCGEVINKAECTRRVQLQEQQGVMMFYAIALDGNHYIDATSAGNLARYVNHSCEPNMKCEKWSVLGETRVGFFALRDIPKGTELTIDYQFSTIAGTGLVTGMQKCACDSLRCRGFLGAKVGGAKRRIRPEWCEELQVGMLCDVLAGDKTWRPGKVCEMGDRGGVTHLRIQYLPDNATSNIPAVRVKHADNAIDSTKSSTIVGNSCEWIPITSMIERIAPARAFTSPEAVQRRKTEESIRQREAAAANAQKQAEAATKPRPSVGDKY